MKIGTNFFLEIENFFLFLQIHIWEVYSKEKKIKFQTFQIINKAMYAMYLLFRKENLQYM